MHKICEQVQFNKGYASRRVYKVNTQVRISKRHQVNYAKLKRCKPDRHAYKFKDARFKATFYQRNLQFTYMRGNHKNRAFWSFWNRVLGLWEAYDNM